MTNDNNDTLLLDLQLIATTTFIITSIISLIIIYNEKLTVTKRDNLFSEQQALNLSFYNRIAVLIVVILTLYISYMSYKGEEVGSIAQYKSFLILGTNILTIISALVLLYVAYLNKKERSITPADIINPLL